MKTRLGTIFALFAITFLLVWRASAAQVGVLWDYDFTLDRACSPALPTNCIKEFKVKEGSALLATVPAPVGASGPVVGIAATINFAPPYGSRIIHVVAVSEDGVESDPSNTVSVNVKPGKPQNARIP